MAQLAIRITEEDRATVEEFRRRCKDKGYNLSAVIRKLMGEWLKETDGQDFSYGVTPDAPAHSPPLATGPIPSPAA